VQELVKPMTESLDPQRLLPRARAAMLAAASGDALGWPIEPRGNRVGGTRDLEPRLDFIAWTRREGGGYAPHERPIPAGAYSDDTQLMLAVARSLGVGDRWWKHLTEVELPLWVVYQLGGGGAIRRAANSWGKGIAPWSERAKPTDRGKYFEAGANGVVMRILPHAIFTARDDSFDRAAERIVVDGIATHGHPRALVGALAAGYAMWAGLRWRGKIGYGDLVARTIAEADHWATMPSVDRYAPDFSASADDTLDTDYSRIWDRTVEEMLGLLSSCREAMDRGSLARDSQVLEDLGAFGSEGGAGTRTAAVGFYMASRYITRPPAGLLAAAFARKTDTDTNACVTGALLGALTGDDWIGTLAQKLQDSKYIDSLARAVVEHERTELPSAELQPAMKRKLSDRLSRLDIGGSLFLPVFGEARVESVERVETRANEVTLWWIDTELGQRLSIEKVTKRKVGDGKGSTAATRPEPDSKPGPGGVRRIWISLEVRDLHMAKALYGDVVGLAVLRQGPGFVYFKPNLLLKQDEGEQGAFQPHLGQGARVSFETRQFVVVLVDHEVLLATHRRLEKANVYLSRVVSDPEGDRFRFVDPDGHTVEVRAEPK
jgi:ADP-ribosylglycohydrolase/catechol 2,3-dioxygenase-like lactoylglutathione lyase family enzyme